MKGKILTIPLFFFFSVLSLLKPVYGAENPDLLALPEQLGIALGIGTFAGGILASGILILMWVIPINIFVKGRGDKSFLTIISTLVIISLAVVMNWLPLFTLVLIVLLIAGLWGQKTKGWFT